MKLAFQILILMLSTGGLPLAAQLTPVAGGQTVKWQTLNSKEEFSIAMPEGAKGYTEDNEYYIGGAKNRVTKRIFVYRSINGTVLMTEMLEGDVRGVSDELVSRISQGKSAYELVRSEDFGGVTLRRYQRRQDKLYSVEQFILFKKRLYVVQAHANEETNPILNQYLRSLSINVGGKALMPNLSATDDAKLALKPPDIVIAPLMLSDDDEPLREKPDREVIYLHNPRPRYTSDARRAGVSGEIRLRVLFAASGKIKKVEVESGDVALRESAMAAAERILFIPAEKNGRPVSVWRTLSYSFSIY